MAIQATMIGTTWEDNQEIIALQLGSSHFPHTTMEGNKKHDPCSPRVYLQEGVLQ